MPASPRKPAAVEGHAGRIVDPASTVRPHGERDCRASGPDPQRGARPPGRAPAGGTGARGRPAAGRQPAGRGIRGRSRGGGDLLEGLHPFVAHLLRVCGSACRRLSWTRSCIWWVAASPRSGRASRGDLPHRVEAASALLEDLGALNTVEKLNGGLVIRGYGCLLSAAVHGRPEVCRAMESLLAELLEAPVRECCERGERPRCCFEIGPPPRGGSLEATH